MGLYNFQPQFVPFIKAGTKKHTIREVRKHPDKPGDTLYLYKGLRTKKARRIIPPVKCVKVERIEITPWFPDAEAFMPWEVTVKIEDVTLSASECDALAKRDGFPSWADMVLFWQNKNELPFVGHIIHWK